jgi:hypothetical protein
LRLEQPRRTVGVARIAADDLNKFEFLLSLVDALQRRKLSLNSETYVAIIREGVRVGGIRRKIASLLIKSRSRSLPGGKRISDESHDERDPSTPITWVDLLKHFSIYREKLEDSDLPSVTIRCNDQELRRVLQAEQSLSMRSRI